MLSLIVAKADNGVIGRDNQLPWHLPEDLKHFKACTMGKPLIMGRKTFDSLPGVLPGRPHVVISRNAELALPANCYRTSSLDQAIEKAIELSGEEQEVVVIGGGEIYQQALALVDLLYVTEVHTQAEGDAFFPEIDPQVWQESARERYAGKLDFSFVTYQRRKP